MSTTNVGGKKRILALFATALVLFSGAPALSASPTLWGVVYDSKNAPLSGVQIAVTQLGKQISTAVTGSDGTYNFQLATGAYSLRLTPPNTTLSALNAYDIDIPLTKGLNFYLTPPTPGRAFLTGSVTPPRGFDIDANIAFGGAAGKADQTGSFRLTPTSGVTSTFSLTGATKGDSVSYRMLGKTPLTLLQDTIVDFNLPLYRQKIRVVTATGTPVAGASIDGGVGSLVSTSTPNLAMTPVEGVGEFEGSWRVYAGSMTTDKDGYVTLPALTMAQPAAASFTILPPASARFALQVFQTTVGAGDITLTLTKSLPSVSGTVRDLAGKAIAGIAVDVMTNNPNSRSQSGGRVGVNSDGTFEVIAEANDNYIASVSLKRADDPNNTFVFRTSGDKTNLSIPQDKNISMVVPINTTRVRVLDPSGKPLANSYVSLKTNPSSTTELTGKLTVMAGKAPLNTYLYSTGLTNADGFVTLPTLRFDAEVDGLIFASPPSGSPLTYASTIAKIGAGKDVTITLQTPLVTVSGRIAFTDGIPLSASSKYAPSFNSGKGDGLQSYTMSADGRFSGKIGVGITGTWTIGCGAIDRARAADFVPCLSGGPSTVARTDWSQDFVVPTSRTPIQVVDANGRGIPNVRMLINSRFYSETTLQLVPNQSAYSAWYISTATTDANGWASLVNLKLAAPQKVYLEATPDPTSRYQTQSLSITVGDNSKNVVVLQILKPVISSVMVSVINGVRTATITGENFTGTTGVTAGTFSFNDFTNRTGAKTTQGFTVRNNNQITFPVPAGLTSATVTVTNGGGSATSGVIRFN